jgi:hypothetical protein
MKRPLRYIAQSNSLKGVAAMADVTLDRIIRDAFSLPPQEQRRLLELLKARIAQTPPTKTIEELAKQQGKRPLDFGRIRDLGAFFPADESIDDLISTVRILREDKATRPLD